MGLILFDDTLGLIPLPIRRAKAEISIDECRSIQKIAPHPWKSGGKELLMEIYESRVFKISVGVNGTTREKLSANIDAVILQMAG
jgi:hypothetical protein